MNIQKFTQKSIEAIQKAQSLVIENENSQIEQEHLLYALLIGENSLIKELLKKMNVGEEFQKTVKNEIDNKPRMHSETRQMEQVYISRDVDEALAILKFTPKAASPLVEKVLKSAIANAEHNLNLDINSLYVKEAYVNEGTTLKRFRPRAQGRASQINKRTSHITIVVAEKK